MVVASCTSPDYSGSVANQLIISQAAAVVTQGNLLQVYNGNPLSITTSTTPGGMTVNTTYNGLSSAPLNAGNYTVLSIIVNSNYIGSATGTLVINQTPAAITIGNLTQTYSGQAEPVTVTTIPTNLTATVSYNAITNAPTNAGFYTVVAILVDSNYVGSATNTLTIVPALPIMAFSGLFQTYDDTTKTVTVTITPANLATTLTYNGSTIGPINEGNYTVVCTVAGTNYAGSVTNTMVIAQATATIKLGSLVQAWSGNPCAVTAVTTPAGLNLTITYNGVAQAPSALGTYTVVATINDPNYSSTITASLVIKTVAPPSEIIISWNAQFTPVTLFESTDLAAWTVSSEMPDVASSNPSDVITTSVPVLGGNLFFTATSQGRGIPIGIASQL
jgi:hypothetical protein